MILEEVVSRGLDYVVLKRKQTSEKAKATQRFSIDSLVKTRGLHLSSNEWHETSLIYV